MDFEKIAEEKIREAMERGEFDNLPGSGKPLQGLDSYFATPEEVRLGFSVLKNAGFIPEETALLKEIRFLKDKAGNCTNPESTNRLNTQIAELQLKYDLLMDRFRKSHRSVEGK